MLRSKAVRVKREGQPVQDRVLGHADFLGRIGSLLAPVANWANQNPFQRWIMEKTLGIHRKRTLPRYAPEVFRRWFEKRAIAANDPEKRAALFYTCSVNFNEPQVGRACVRVLEKNRVELACPEQRCCGMPFLDGGDIEGATNNARLNVDAFYPLVEKGYDIVVPGPTCSYMLKQEYPVLLKDDRARKISERTFDVSEYLMLLHSEGKLDTEFAASAGRVAYQVPCHLRAQNIGYKARDLMELIPETAVHVIEKCAAMDGTWGLKRQYFDLSNRVAEPLLREIRGVKRDVVVSDCPLAGLQIRQGLGEKPLHPIQILERAYGLEDSEKS
jgi:Fe-S oxidoreductase